MDRTHQVLVSFSGQWCKRQREIWEVKSYQHKNTEASLFFILLEFPNTVLSFLTAQSETYPGFQNYLNFTQFQQLIKVISQTFKISQSLQLPHILGTSSFIIF